MGFPINENYKLSLKLKRHAYVYGFWLADGNICYLQGKYKTRRTQFTSKDIELLETVQAVLQTNTKINKHTRDTYYWYNLCIGGSTLYNSILSLGGQENKSLVMEFPKDVPEENLWHLIRGYFDGDGSVGVYDTGGKYHHKALRASFASGSRQFLKELQKRLKKYGIESLFSSNIKNRKNPVYSLTVFSQQARKMFKFLYDDSKDFRLERKYILYENGLKFHPISAKKRWTESELNFLRNNYKKLYSSVYKYFPRWSKSAIELKAQELNLQIPQKVYKVIKCAQCGTKREVNKSNAKRVKLCRSCQKKINNEAGKKADKRYQEKLKQARRVKNHIRI